LALISDLVLLVEESGDDPGENELIGRLEGEVKWGKGREFGLSFELILL
jgi:hypothetical protein